ncbi:cytochrome P450 [Dactylosporangium sp. NPDC005572]|uniref:cytochrome P450 n=1 Tax=Dactylosporangium sp. NPDC005572 TaxID=3156889 RepID=UPI0033B92B6F
MNEPGGGPPPEPVAALDALRGRGGGVCPVAGPAPFHAVLGAPEVRAVLRDHDAFPSRFGPGLAYAQPGGVLVASDPPDHTAQRALLAPAFRPAAIAALERPVRELVDRLVGDIAPHGRADLVTDLAAPLSLRMVCGLLGLHADDIPRYWSWVLKLGEGLLYPAGSLDRRIVDAYRAFYEHFHPHLQRRRRDLERGLPAPDDLLTHLMTARPGGRALSHPQLLAFCQFLLVAGSSTTVMLVGNLVHRLLGDPDQLAGVRADPSLLPAAVEESLRVDTPLLGLFRTSAGAQRLAGVDLPDRAKLLVMFAAANRDPVAWPDPHRFDVRRDPAALRRHSSFGHGAHYCLGAPLARLEATVLVGALLDRLPGLRAAGAPRRVPAAILHGFDHLPIAWDPPTA